MHGNGRIRILYCSENTVFNRLSMALSSSIFPSVSVAQSEEGEGAGRRGRREELEKEAREKRGQDAHQDALEGSQSSSSLKDDDGSRSPREELNINPAISSTCCNDWIAGVEEPREGVCSTCE